MTVDLDSGYDTQKKELLKVFYPDVEGDSATRQTTPMVAPEDIPELILKKVEELQVVKEHGLPEIRLSNGCIDIAIPRTYAPWDAVRIERILRAACTEVGVKLLHNRVLYYYKRVEPHVIRSDMKQRVTYVDCLDRTGNLTQEAIRIFQRENENQRVAKVGNKTRHYFCSIDRTLYIVITKTYKYDVQSESFAGW